MDEDDLLTEEDRQRPEAPSGAHVYHYAPDIQQVCFLLLNHMAIHSRFLICTAMHVCIHAREWRCLYRLLQCRQGQLCHSCMIAHHCACV